jgi:hypothetical protein
MQHVGFTLLITKKSAIWKNRKLSHLEDPVRLAQHNADENTGPDQVSFD